MYGLQQQLKDHPEEFDKYNHRRNFEGSPHKDMRDIWVRYNDINTCEDMSKFGDEHDSVWYPVLDKIPSAKKIALDLMARVGGERLGGILITKLPPGGKILPHVDSGWHAQYYDKFYIPILTSDGDRFCFKGGKINANLGEAWWFNNARLHWVDNDSSSERIAMIVCIRTEEFKEHNPERLK